MKNLITFLISCLSMTALLAQVKNDCVVRVLSDDASGTTFSLAFSQKIDNLEAYQQVWNIRKLTPMLQAGAPELPKFSTAVVLPNTGNSEIEIIGGQFIDLEGVEILPSKGDLKRNIDPASVPYQFGAAFQRDEFFPGRLAELKSPFVFREVRGQAVWLFPFQYNPVQKTLRIYHQLTVRVVHTKATGENELLQLPPHRSRVFQEIFEQTFINFSNRNTRNDLEKGAGGKGIEKMLAIVDDPLLEELQPLLLWKRQSGISVEVALRSEIGSSNAADLHQFISKKYAEVGYTYLLVVGDENKFIPEMRPSGGSLYACDNCYGYQTGNDHLPEILVGRLHARNAKELKIMVERNLEYEKSPLVDANNNWCATGMAVASDEGAGIGDDGQIDYEHGNEWKAKHLADGCELYYEFYQGNQAQHSPTPGSPTADLPDDPTAAQLLALFNGRGAGLMNYTGHGWEQGIVTGNFDVNSVEQMKNAGRYPTVIIVGCCSGNFTVGDCLGEAMQRASDPSTGKPTGAICSFMSSDYQSWAPPMEGQDGMNQFLVDADGIQIKPTMSGMLAVGNAKMIIAYGQGGELMADFWNPFTEPSTVPRTRLPKQILAQHSPSTFIGTTSLSINCDVEGALVTAFWQGEPIGTGIVTGGVATINFSALQTVDNLTVTATQFNHIPYQGQISVVPAAGPFVISKKVELDDSAGNKNGKADFGENILFNLEIENVGVENATATSIKISTDDPKISVTDDQEIFGDLAPSQILSRPAAFACSIADDVEDGRVVNFKLNIQFSDTMGYQLNLPVTLQAPKLEVKDFKISDAPPLGNGNGRLEVGEKAIVSIQNFNKGRADSPDGWALLTSDNPFLKISDAIAINTLAAQTGVTEAQFTVEVLVGAPKNSPAIFDYQIATGKYSAQLTTPKLLVNAIMEDWEKPNFSTFSWENNGGDKPWQLSPTGAYQGKYCVRSSIINHNQKSVLSLNLNVLEDGEIGFARRVSSEQGYDFLRFKIDGVTVAEWSGNLNWTEVSFPISKGQHKLTWSYEKDQLGNDGSDRAWIDNILLPLHDILVNTSPNLTAERVFDLAIFPNPASEQASLQFNLPVGQTISVHLHDQLGRKVRTLAFPQFLQGGKHTLSLDLAWLRPGVYLILIEGTTNNDAIKLVKM